MKLLVMAPSAYKLGGVQSWLDYLLPGLKHQGIEPVLGLVDGYWHDSAGYLEHHPWEPTEIVTNPSGSVTGRVRAIRQAIDRVNPGLVLSANVGDTLEALRGLKLRDGHSPRLMVTVHGVEGDYISELQHFSDMVDSVVVTNRLTGRLINELTSVPTHRVFYAPYGVDLDVPQSAMKNSGTILWMGRLERHQKRVMELPCFCRMLARTGYCWRVIVAGDGPEAANLREKMAEIREIKVEFPGSVSHDRIIEDVLPSSGMLLVNSSWETGPITIWEAMAAGVPVVSSRYLGSGVEAALANGDNALLFDLGDMEAAVAHMCSLRSDAALYQRIVSGGRRLVFNRYSRAVSLDCWRAALQKTLNLPKTRPDGNAVDQPQHGRLDRWLGAESAESVRRLLGIRFRHGDAGSEWPHVSWGMPVEGQKGFLETARALDNPADPGS